MLRHCVPGDPRSCQMDGRTISTNIDSWFNRSCKRRPDKVSGHTFRWFCQPWLERIISWSFTRYNKLTFLFVWRSIYIVFRSFVYLFNGREIFWFVMMPLSGGRAIITLRADDRDRGRHRGCQRSLEVTCHHFIPVLSLYRWRNVGRGRLLEWRARPAYFSQWSGQNISR